MALRNELQQGATAVLGQGKGSVTKAQGDLGIVLAVGLASRSFFSLEGTGPLSKTWRESGQSVDKIFCPPIFWCMPLANSTEKLVGKLVQEI